MVALPLQSNIIPFPCEPPQGKSNEWYTPSRYVEAARRVMGTIDLDPASCELANKTVKAAHYYSKEDDGLTQAWYGNVWLNPPYSRTTQMEARHQSFIGMFIEKLISCYVEGDVTQAVMLITCRTDTTYFRALWDYPICFSDHLLHFTRPREHQRPKNPTGTHMQGTCFVYLGTNEQAFIREFSAFGTIARAIAGPRRETVQARLWEGSQA